VGTLAELPDQPLRRSGSIEVPFDFDRHDPHRLCGQGDYLEVQLTARPYIHQSISRRMRSVLDFRVRKTSNVSASL